MKLYNKYKPPPKTIKPSPSKVTATVTKAKKKDESDSSSDDDNFVNPNELDLASDFFNKNQKTKNADEAPVFDCNAGMNLTDSSDGGSDDDDDDNGSAKKVDLNRFTELHANLERAKAQLAKTNFQPTVEEQKEASHIDVTALLSLGEGTSGQKHSSKQKKMKSNKKVEKEFIDSDESDWEEVEGMNFTFL